MRKSILATFILTLGLSAPLSVSAKTTGDLPAASAVKITISVSEDLAHRADHLPKKLRDRGSARSSRDGWAGNGHYGQRAIEHLRDDVRKELSDDMAKFGVQQSDNAAYELRITIVDAEPTRPTFKQLSKQPGLSYQSVGNGGATLKAELLDGSGNVLGQLDYDWYENNLRENYGFSTWSDAERAISRFSRIAIKSLNN